MSPDRGEPRTNEEGSGRAVTSDSASLPDLSDDVLHEMVLDGTSECLVVVDERNVVVFANPALEEVFGYEPAELVGERLTKLIPERLRTDHLEAFARYLRTGERTADWDHLEFPGKHRDGHEVPLHLSFREFSRGTDRYFVGVVRDVTERAERRDRLVSEKAFVESIFDALPDVVYAFHRDGQFLRWNERANEVTGYTDEEIAELDPVDAVPEDDRRRVAESLNQVMIEGKVDTVESALVTKDGREIPYEFTGAPLREDGEIIGETGVGRDISDRVRREEQLRRLNELNTVIRSVHQALIEAATRREIETAVPDRLVSESGYVGAVMGRLDGDESEFSIDASAGVDTSSLNGLVSGADDADSSIAEQAVGSRSVRCARSLQDATGSSQRHASGEGYRSAAAVPLVHAERTFGVLCVYADRPDAFDERERTILRELGEAIGNVIESALTHRLLYADSVTEIELRTADTSVPFVALSEAADCRLELTRALSFGDDLVTYFSVSGTDPEAVMERAREIDSFATVEYLGSTGDDYRFQLVVGDGTMSPELSSYGARTVAGYAERGVGRFTVELPPNASVRTVVAQIQSEFPDAELLARREVERSLRTPMAFRRELAAEMTEKQRTALEAAYFAGYFEWPSRASNAEEIADALDIAPQTFHQHFRVAQRKLLRALLEERVTDE